MWTSSLALNGLISTGKNFMWSCHYIEHELSANYDITHGAWLATLTPKWMRYVRSDATVDKFYAYAVNVWSMTPATEDKFAVANEGIEATEEFFRSIGLPMTLAEFKIDDSRLEETTAKAVEVGYLSGAYVPLDEKDVVEILKMCM
ncbi:MAG TPA: iron-containing alcohol dehydrogenase [Candidatus Dorea gallistercoris]|uniref:Iron-containing alcohol dehydrogenase n=1 Tax=Candidatus Dorea gallistercoris TaxID=2838542 RepID=A0A9D1UFI1_9FIRM|nr:iron-containing alcohol dehydrogenase [Candidatus Dorea gallistercoris]